MRYKTIPKDINGKFVIQRIKPIEYNVFDDVDKFITFYSSVSDERKCYNEVIFNSRQKMRIDIDADINSMTKEEWDESMKIIHHVFKFLLSKQNIAIYEMSDETKYSCHMICTTLYFDNSEICRYICNVIADKCKEHGKYIDKSVYNKVQHFRMEYSTKPGTKRYKYVTHSDDDYNFEDGLITYTKKCKHADIKINSPKQINTSFNKCAYKVHLDWCVSVSQSKDNKLIIMRRLKPSFCGVCSRIHTSENPYIIVVSDTMALLYCRRSVTKEYTKLRVEGTDIY